MLLWTSSSLKLLLITAISKIFVNRIFSVNWISVKHESSRIVLPIFPKYKKFSSLTQISSCNTSIESNILLNHRMFQQLRFLLLFHIRNGLFTYTLIQSNFHKHKLEISRNSTVKGQKFLKIAEKFTTYHKGVQATWGRYVFAFSD